MDYWSQSAFFIHLSGFCIWLWV